MKENISTMGFTFPGQFFIVCNYSWLLITGSNMGQQFTKLNGCHHFSTFLPYRVLVYKPVDEKFNL
uniref:Uncharacterized protein n=1 Tax=Rhizophora mucronata TaxID=61149 RepID=A0A2P2PVG5_RHIMU